jgi:hypothetical protein
MGKVLHASKSGYFTSCIQNGDGYWSLERAMEIYWRVKKWELNMSTTYLIDFPENPEIITLSTGANRLLTNGSGQEEDLVCSSAFYADTGFAEITFGDAAKSGSLYSAGFIFFADFSANFGLGDFALYVNTGGDGTDVRSYSVYGSTPIEFSYTITDLYAEFFVLQDATFSLEPKEWWSYGGTYDTSTGARL